MGLGMTEPLENKAISKYDQRPEGRREKKGRKAYKFGGFSLLKAFGPLTTRWFPTLRTMSTTTTPPHWTPP
jgi:hypothetical protein